MKRLSWLGVTFFLTCAARAGDIPLSGAWQVRLPDGAEAEVALPGTLGEAGLGEVPTTSRPGTLTPRRQFVGKAVYSKTFTVPEGTQGDHELFLERVMWKSAAA